MGFQKTGAPEKILDLRDEEVQQQPTEQDERDESRESDD